MNRIVIVLAIVGALAGCSSDSSAIDAAAARQRIVDELHLPDSLGTCLEADFDAHPAARRALDPARTPNEDELDALSDVVAACVPAGTFADSVSVQMATGYRSVADIPPAKEQCLRDQIAALSDDDRGLFVTGPVSRLRAPESERSLAVSDLLGRLLDACEIVVGTAPVTDTTVG